MDRGRCSHEREFCGGRCAAQARENPRPIDGDGDRVVVEHFDSAEIVGELDSHEDEILTV